MHLIFMVDSSNSECNCGCNYAVVELTPALVEQIHQRAALVRQAAQQDANLDEISFWDSAADFYGSALADACQAAVAAHTVSGDANQAAADWLTDLETDGYAAVPQGVDLDKFDAQRTECDRIIVSSAVGDRDDCEICWKSMPKHADLYVTTWELPLSAMEKLVASAPAARENPPPAAEIAEAEIRLPCYGITIRLDRAPSAERPASGTITSDLKQDTAADDATYIAAIDGLESLILAHACAGIDVTSPDYIEGIETAVEAISNHQGV